jgi:hypothetical protein
MDLIGRVAVIVIVLVIIFSVGFIIFTRTTQTKLTSAQAVQFVLNDLRATNPTANVSVINVSNSSLKSGSYSIILSIVSNSTRPCPTLEIQGYDYPATGLVPSVDNLYTRNCIVYGISDAPQYVIYSPAVAIARTYNQSVEHNITQVTNYVNTFGYNNTVVHAKFYSVLNNTNTHLSQGYYNVWLVNYTATSAKYSVYAVLNSNGAVIGNYTNKA